MWGQVWRIGKKCLKLFCKHVHLWQFQINIFVKWIKLNCRLTLRSTLSFLPPRMIIHVVWGYSWALVRKTLFLIFQKSNNQWLSTRTTDTQWRHKSKISEKLGRCGRQNMLPPYLKIWDWDWIFGRAVQAISSLGVRSPWLHGLPS